MLREARLRDGIAEVVFSDGRAYRLDPATFPSLALPALPHRAVAIEQGELVIDGGRATLGWFSLRLATDRAFAQAVETAGSEKAPRFARALLAARQRAGLTPGALAAQSGVPLRQIVQLELGELQRREALALARQLVGPLATTLSGVLAACRSGEQDEQASGRG